MDPWSYLAPRGPSSSELKVQGSRFIAHLAPASDSVSALAFLEALRKRYHDATHHCWAFRVGWDEGLQCRSSDDGEPSHTAGEPILHALEERVVSDACLVVVRYFGGVKLGTGGLARAYRDSARQTLDGAALEDRVLCVVWEIALPYAAEGSLRHAAAASGVQWVSRALDTEVTLTARVPRSGSGAFEGRLTQLREAWKGAVRWKSK